MPTVTALIAQGMTIMLLFVVQVIVGTTRGDTQYSVNKQTNNMLILTPSGDRKYQLLLAAHMRCFLEENKFSFHYAFYEPLFKLNNLLCLWQVCPIKGC